MNINLLPWREQRLQKMWFQFLWIGTGGLLVVIVLIIFLHFTLLANNRRVFAHYVQLQTKILAQSRHIKLSAMRQPSLPTLRLLKKIEYERRHILSALRAIVQSLPSTGYLTQLQYHDAWTIQGRASTMQAISEFILHLKHHHDFHQVTLSNVVNQKSQQYFIYRIRIS